MHECSHFSILLETSIFWLSFFKNGSYIFGVHNFWKPSSWFYCSVEGHSIWSRFCWAYQNVSEMEILPLLLAKLPGVEETRACPRTQHKYREVQYQQMFRSPARLEDRWEKHNIFCGMIKIHEEGHLWGFFWSVNRYVFLICTVKHWPLCTSFIQAPEYEVSSALGGIGTRGQQISWILS